MGIVSGGFCFKRSICFFGFENKSASNLLPDVEKYLYELPVGFNRSLRSLGKNLNVPSFKDRCGRTDMWLGLTPPPMKISHKNSQKFGHDFKEGVSNQRPYDRILKRAEQTHPPSAHPPRDVPPIKPPPLGHRNTSFFQDAPAPV